MRSRRPRRRKDGEVVSRPKKELLGSVFIVCEGLCTGPAGRRACQGGGMRMALEKLLWEERSLFHVHTWRCGHAQRVSEEDTVREAVALEASHLFFTDHAPFPGDPFGSRMPYAMLEDYLSTLGELQKRFEGSIQVHIGLEIEYFPEYRGYYEELLGREPIELLLLGQHMAEVSPGRYSFSLDRREQQRRLHSLVAEAMAEGMETGFFPVCAHPERLFWFREVWDESCEEAAGKIREAALGRGVLLEKNLASIKDGFYREEFWEPLSDDSQVVYGIDAHSLRDLKDAVREFQGGLLPAWRR